jgi:hypothetical protein
MKRRTFLRSAVAGLLTAASPAGLLVGPATRSVFDVIRDVADRKAEEDFLEMRQKGAAWVVLDSRMARFYWRALQAQERYNASS